MVKRLEWTPELVGKFWDGVAGTALDDLSFGRVAGSQFLDFVAPFLSASGRHLDFGAGSGHIVSLLLDRGYKTAGYEPSSERQAALEERVGRKPGFLGVVGRSSVETFDVVLLLEVIEHVLEPDLAGILDRINHFLPMGGHVIISTPNHEDLEHASVYCPVSDVFFHPWQHVRSFTPESLTALMSNFGFERQFLGLVDFSADLEMYEQLKRIRLRRDAARRYLASHDDFNKSFRNALEGRRAVIKPLKPVAKGWRYLRRLSDAFEYAHTLWLLGRQGRSVVALLDEVVFPEADRSASDPSPYNLRVGRETTIIYSGEKIGETDQGFSRTGT